MTFHVRLIRDIPIRKGPLLAQSGRIFHKDPNPVVSKLSSAPPHLTKHPEGATAIPSTSITRNHRLNGSI